MTGCDEHDSLPAEFRALLVGALDRIEPVLERLQAQQAAAGDAAPAERTGREQAPAPAARPDRTAQQGGSAGGSLGALPDGLFGAAPDDPFRATPDGPFGTPPGDRFGTSSGDRSGAASGDPFGASVEDPGASAADPLGTDPLGTDPLGTDPLGTDRADPLGDPLGAAPADPLRVPSGAAPGEPTAPSGGARRAAGPGGHRAAGGATENGAGENGTSENGTGAGRHAPGPAAACGVCPICAVIAAWRGERSELVTKAVDHAAGLVAVLRAALDEGDETSTGRHAAPERRASRNGRSVQHIRVRR